MKNTRRHSNPVDRSTPIVLLSQAKDDGRRSTRFIDRLSLIWLGVALASAALPISCARTASQPEAALASSSDQTSATPYLDDGAPASLSAALLSGDRLASAAWQRLPAYRSLAGALPSSSRDAAFTSIATRLQGTTAQDLAPVIAASANLRAGLARLEPFFLPHLASYIPGRVALGRIRLVPFMAEVTGQSGSAYLSTRDGDLLIDPTTPAFLATEGRAADVFARELAINLFRAALVREMPDVPTTTPDDAASLEQQLLHRFQIEGITSWALSQGRALVSLDDAGRATLDRQIAVQRFETISEALRDYDERSSVAETRTRWRVIEARAKESDAYAVIGAYIAALIEAQRGRAGLVATIRPGGRAFWKAYEATEPGAPLWFRLPTDAAFFGPNPLPMPRRAPVPVASWYDDGRPFIDQLF